MMKLFSLSIILVCTLLGCSNEETPQNDKAGSPEVKKKIVKTHPSVSLQENAVGVFYVKDVDQESIEVKIAIPKDFVSGNILLVEEPGKKYFQWYFLVENDKIISLYDDKGKIADISPDNKFIGKFWCENDGGSQYRPQLVLTMSKKDFKRVPRALDPEVSVAGFVSVGSIESKELKPNQTRFKDAKVYSRLKGVLNEIAEIELAIWGEKGEFAIPGKNLMLFFDGETYSMECSDL